MNPSANTKSFPSAMVPTVAFGLMWSSEGPTQKQAEYWVSRPPGGAPFQLQGNYWILTWHAPIIYVPTPTAHPALRKTPGPAQPSAVTVASTQGSSTLSAALPWPSTRPTHQDTWLQFSAQNLFIIPLGWHWGAAPMWLPPTELTESPLYSSSSACPGQAGLAPCGAHARLTPASSVTQPKSFPVLCPPDLTRAARAWRWSVWNSQLLENIRKNSLI